MSNRKSYNLIAKTKIGGIIPSGIKYRDVSEALLLSKIQYLCEEYVIEVIFIYDHATRILQGWYRPVPPSQGLTWKYQQP